MALTPDTGWSKYKTLTITDTAGISANYQMKLEIYAGTGSDNTASGIIYCGNYCINFPDDIRFSTTNDTLTGTQLNQWIANGYTTSHATIWIKMPSDGANTIYMFIGNESANFTSDGDNTFIFFDDFENNNLDRWTHTSSWTTQNTTVYEGTYAAYAYNVASNELYKTLSSALNYSFSWHMNVQTDKTNDLSNYIPFIMSCPDTVWAIAMGRNDPLANKLIYNQGSWTAWPQNNTITTNTWYSIDLHIDFEASQQKGYKNNLSLGAIDCKDASGNNFTSITLLELYDSKSPKAYADQVYVRKWYATEPTWNTFSDFMSGGEARFTSDTYTFDIGNCNITNLTFNDIEDTKTWNFWKQNNNITVTATGIQTNNITLEGIEYTNPYIIMHSIVSVADAGDIITLYNMPDSNLDTTWLIEEFSYKPIPINAVQWTIKLEKYYN